MAWEQVAGAVAAPILGGLASSIFGGDDRKRAQQALKMQMAELSQIKALMAEGRYIADWTAGQADALGKKRIQEAEKGLTFARTELERTGRFGREEILGREQEAFGSARSSMMSRGLSGTTAQDAMERGIRYDTNRSLLDLTERTAGMRSNLAVSSTALFDNILSSVTQQKFQGAGLQVGTRTNEAQIRSGFQYGATPTGSGDFAARLAGDVSALVASNDFWKSVGGIFEQENLPAQTTGGGSAFNVPES